ncbi:ornithine carbamoyltransferase [Pseudidiomarina planktonica]|uniref:Ornithine carbamoyltransferase n=1 Tax=Pseudidiomarina planktonica TaxID=1323738 RepID=A0A1Y6G053_9GAMM|nr:ornithine carbamoyltransferase [Pseudidiomarina planktonica]RUO64003.1 ornithine carbamoyltransferase [Pseudidiomarina planktonica]SMQ79905.1 ornithine carbamoyltransferase [Pseudidiomarina planktonica]
MNDLLALTEVSPQQLNALLQLSTTMKQNPAEYANALTGKSIAMLFEKPSLRTRSSFAAGINRLGGHSIYLDANTVIGERETAADVGANLACWHDAIVARVFKQSTLHELANASDKPVINALSDTCHPCQAIADVLTLQELFGDLSQVQLTWIGDGNNVCHALINAAALVGMKLQIVTPKGYEANTEVLATAQGIASQTGAQITQTTSLDELLPSDAIYTDTWFSMGQQRDESQVMHDFAPYQVNCQLMQQTGAQYFMHCLPAQRGREVTAEVLDSDQAVVLKQAENRLFAQNAILMTLLTGDQQS